MISVRIQDNWCELRYDRTMTFVMPSGLLPEYAELATRYNGVFVVKVVTEVISDSRGRSHDTSIAFDAPHLTFASEGDYALFKLSCDGLI
jgi:hypothetical protein